MGRLLVITGPSGVGKTTLADRLCVDGWFRCVTCTTRLPREGEQEGVDYFFLSEAAFDQSRKAGHFIESNTHYGKQYGIRERELQAQVQNKDVVVLLNWAGALKVKAAFPKALVIYIMPPSLEVLSARLGKRGDSLRMQYAAEDMAQAEKFEHILVNEDLDACYRALLALIRKEIA